MFTFCRPLALLAALLLLALPPAPARAKASFDCTVVTDVAVAECEALVALYDATDGPNWTNNDNWLTDTNVSSWSGVSVSGSSVTTISLNNNNLTGTLPLEIKDLAHLRYLYLQGNQLSGSIPVELEELAQLRALDLQDNQLSGSIPGALGELAFLRVLDLQGNQLSGSIPGALGGLKSLTNLYLGENQLTGSIPDALGGLTSLTHLYLGSNELSGSIPAALGELENLDVLNVWSNQLSGSIPAALGDLPNLRYLSLAGNELSGSIPSEIGNLTSLLQLNLESNQLSGSIPAALGDLPELRWVFLYDNQLSGSIPAALGNLPNLTTLDLSGNTGLCGDPPDFTSSPTVKTTGTGIGTLCEAVCSATTLSEPIYGQSGGHGTATITFTNADGIEAVTFTALTNLTADAPDGWSATATNAFAPAATPPQTVTFTLTQADPTDADASYYAQAFSTCPGETDDRLLTDFDPPLTMTTAGASVASERGPGVLPEVLTLESAYPNPFNPQTTVRFALPASGPVFAEVFDAVGRRVSVLRAGEQMPAGWHRLTFEAASLATGLYLLRVEAGGTVQTARLMLVK